GRGGMGTVYKTQNASADCQSQLFALKIPLWNDQRKEATREVLTAAGNARLDLQLRLWIIEILLLDFLSNHKGIPGVMPCLDHALKGEMYADLLGDFPPQSCGAPMEPIGELADRILHAMLDTPDGEDRYRDHPIWVLMPWCEDSLESRRCRSGGQIPFEQGRHFLVQVADTMAKLNELDVNILHRDLKPSNVMITSDDVPLVSDFGLAIDRFDQRSSGNSGCGTKTFSSPESEHGLPVDSVDEVYSWGQLAWRILVGRDPNALKSSKDRRSSSCSMADVKQVPLYFAEIVNQTTASRETRISDFPSLLERIRHAENVPDGPPHSNPLPSSTSPSRSASKIRIADLRPDQEWLPFIRDNQTCDRLDAFLGDHQPFRWWGIVGEGGVGKTRLAQDLAHRWRNRWHVLRLDTRNRESIHQWLIDGRADAWNPVRSTLIIVDYSPLLSRHVLTLLERLTRKGFNTGVKIRLLFLDRPASSPTMATIDDVELVGGADGSLRTTIRSSLFVETKPEDQPENQIDIGVGLDMLKASFKSAIPASEQKSQKTRGDEKMLVEKHELLELSPSPRENWPETVQSILDLVVEGNRVKLPPLEDEAFWDQVDRLTGGGRMLSLQVLAICFARRPERINCFVGDDQGLGELLDEMLEYERDHQWSKLIRAEIREDPKKSAQKWDELEQLERAFALTTLAGGAHLPTDKPFYERILDEEAWKAFCRQHDLRRRSDSNESVFLEAIQPDLLGERLVVNQLNRAGSSPKRPLHLSDFENQVTTPNCDDWVARCLRLDPTRTLESLGRIVCDFPLDGGMVLLDKLFAEMERMVAERPDAQNEDETEKQLLEHLSSGFSIACDWIAIASKSSGELADQVDGPIEQIKVMAGGHNLLWRGAWYAATAADLTLESLESLRDRLYRIGCDSDHHNRIQKVLLQNSTYVVGELVSKSDTGPIPREGRTTKWIGRAISRLEHLSLTDDAYLILQCLNSATWLMKFTEIDRSVSHEVDSTEWIRICRSIFEVAYSSKWVNHADVQARLSEAICTLLTFLPDSPSLSIPDRWQRYAELMDQLIKLANREQWSDN
ncbi:MAG: protein kinase, partial [Planctomycetota bacterium]